jgi:feruloyl esterase
MHKKNTPLAAGILLFLAGGVSVAAAQAPASPAAACQALAGFKIAASAIGERTTGAEVTAVDLVAADAKGNANGEYCKVLGAIHPVDRNAPDIQFEVNLPTSWNRKMLQYGGGGLNGVLVTGLGPYSRQPETDATPLKRGYVTLGSDSGHQSNIPFDGRFYMNAEALANYGHLQIKKTHDVAVQLIKARYAAKADHSYFIGASQGGHEGFDAVQRYPQDYDGVVAGYPAHNVVMLHLSAWNYAKALMADGGKAWINPAKARALVAKVYERCDALDGASDGVISNLAGCEAKNAELRQLTDGNPIRCPGGADTGDSCLSDPQLRALNAIDKPFEVGFRIFADDVGSAAFPKWTPFSGSTFKDGGGDILGTDGPTKALQYAPGAATLGIAIAQDPKLDVYQGFEPKAYEARIRELAHSMSANDTNLDGFRKRGGKMIWFHGLADDFISPYSSIQYFGRLQKRYDAKALDSFVRFYTIPGMGHVTGAFGARLASLDALEAWVEQGKAPGTLSAVDFNKATAGRTRPVCLYPSWPQYDGKGDINAAASFACRP